MQTLLFTIEDEQKDEMTEKVHSKGKIFSICLLRNKMIV